MTLLAIKATAQNLAMNSTDRDVKTLANLVLELANRCAQLETAALETGDTAGKALAEVRASAEGQK